MSEIEEIKKIRDQLRSTRLEDLIKIRDRIVGSLPETSWFDKASETAVYLEMFRRTGVIDRQLYARVFYTVESVSVLSELKPIVRQSPKMLSSVVPRSAVKVLFLSSKFGNYVSSQELVAGLLKEIGSNVEVVLASGRSIDEVYSSLFESFTFVYPLDLREICRKVAPDKIVDLSGDHFNLLATISSQIHLADPWGLSSGCGLEHSSIAWGHAHKYLDFNVGPYTVDDVVPIFVPAESSCRTYPEIHPMSASMTKEVNLGAFCRTSKLNAKVVGIWAELMRANPATTLTFAFIQSNANSETFVKHVFEKKGVAPSRVRFLPRLDTANYLAQLNNIDINLGAMPEQGGVSCVDSLLMGCPYPVCDETSNTFTSSLVLRKLQLDCWVAETLEDYRTLLARLIGDVKTFRNIENRESLRKRLLDSSLSSPVAIASTWSRFLRV